MDGMITKSHPVHIFATEHNEVSSHSHPFLELVYAMLLTSIGSAMIFNSDASSGGTDIAALILKKYTSVDVGKALLIVDFIVAAGAFIVFDIKAGLFSFLVGTVAIIGHLSDPDLLGPCLAVAILSLFYCTIVEILLIPTAVQLKKKIA